MYALPYGYELGAPLDFSITGLPMPVEMFGIPAIGAVAGYMLMQNSPILGTLTGAALGVGVWMLLLTQFD